MGLTRRDFFKVTGVSVTAASLTSMGVKKVHGSYQPVRINYAKEITTICPFCSVGCGIICHVQDGKLLNTEGDPDHPINEGTLCSKGAALFNMVNTYDEKGSIVPNPERLTKVKYRPPNSGEWKELSWEEALDKIADRIKQTRDNTFEQQDENGVTVNRTKAIAHLGSAMCNNEENYLYHKLIRALGVINIDHCARL
ncbi:molybdopterin oxidoreductase Fe4S4 region [Natranaerobius thermophilus JW/NM-WN-LF]|nr:molybdopterin oxidoreductase Fe4S4 region [Natranaerobius thermophilus JW/NM-WN-LF]